jgi:hypothetical protein
MVMVILRVYIAAVLELSASYGSQVCINTDVPEIVSLRDRLLPLTIFMACDFSRAITILFIAPCSVADALVFDLYV